MALNISRLKRKIKEAFTSEMDNEDENKYLENICDKIASAVVEEIKEANITATCPNGKVTIVKIE